MKAFSKSYLKQKKNGVKALKAEISKMRRLNHPNIIKLLEVQETINSVYLIMEYLKGEPIVKRSKDMPQDINRIRKIMRTLLTGIQYLEQNNIVHKDLKPYNILFKKENNNPSSLKILDFGLAADLNDKPNLLKIAGTPGFLAPEIFKSMREKREIGLDSKMDVFSVGVIFYKYIFKKYIFCGNNQKNVYMKNKKCDFEVGGCFESISTGEELRCPMALDLLRKMLEKEPGNRCSVSEALDHGFFRVDEEEEFRVPDESVSKAAVCFLKKEFKSPVFLTEINKKFNSFNVGEGKSVCVGKIEPLTDVIVFDE